jgi:uncharacterized membrane protein YdbT with pleckstrin-like domain
MSETIILEARETRRSYGPLWLALSLLLLGLPFIGRQRITLTNERITVTEGFWTKLRDDIEVFRIRDVVVRQSLWQRLLGIGDVVVKSMEGRSEDQRILRGVAAPVALSETIRDVWNRTARPRGPASTFD